MNNKYLGVYFSIETKTPIAYNAYGKRHWYVWEWDAGTVLLIGTNEKMQPLGQPRILASSVFNSRFACDEEKTKDVPEPPVPYLDALSAQKGYSPAQPNSAEEAQYAKYAEPERAQQTVKNIYSKEELGLAESDARSSFNNGIDEYNKGLQDEAMRSFERPLIITAPWQRKHKHMFSYFGITLRKIKITNLALRYHAKALTLSPNEPNVIFNLARTHLFMGDFNSASKLLSQVLAQKPDLKEALALKEFIDKNR